VPSDKQHSYLCIVMKNYYLYARAVSDRRLIAYDFFSLSSLLYPGAKPWIWAPLTRDIRNGISECNEDFIFLVHLSIAGLRLYSTN